jgi:DNA polymerase V
MDDKKKIIFEFHPVEQDSDIKVNVVGASSVHAGFPAPVQDAYMEQPIDLNKELVRHPATTFITRVVGDSMIDEGVDDGDLLVVDRSLYPTEDQLTVCMLNGDFALKRIIQRDGEVLLVSGNKKYKPIKVTPHLDFRIWGVVTWVLKKKV